MRNEKPTCPCESCQFTLDDWAEIYAAVETKIVAVEQLRKGRREWLKHLSAIRGKLGMYLDRKGVKL